MRDRAIRLVRESERPLADVARELGVQPEALRNWVRQDEADRGERADQAVDTVGFGKWGYPQPAEVSMSGDTVAPTGRRRGAGYYVVKLTAPLIRVFGGGPLRWSVARSRLDP